MGMLSFLHLNLPAEESVVPPLLEPEEALVDTSEQSENLPSDAPECTQLVFGGKKAGGKKASAEQQPDTVKE